MTDEEQIRASLAQAEQGIEQGNVSKALDTVSRNYSDSHGMTRSIMRDGLLEALRSRASFDIVTEVKSLDVTGDQATVKVHVTVTAAWAQSASPESYEGDLTLTFAREGRKWRCVSAEGWQEMGGEIAGDLGF